MDIRNPQCHHHKLDIVPMRVTPLTVLTYMLFTIVAFEILWRTPGNDVFVNTHFLVKVSTLL